MRTVAVTAAAILTSAVGMAANAAMADSYYAEPEPKGELACTKDYKGNITCNVCKFFPDKDNPYPVYTTYDIDLHTGGNKHFKCEFYIKPPEKTVVIKDFKCVIKVVGKDYYDVQWTDDSHWVANKSGKGILTCHFKDKKEEGRK